MLRTLASPVLVGLALLVLAGPTAAQQQQAAASGRLELTTASETARREFQQMLFEFTNLRPLVARQHALNAVTADPEAGLARVYLATAQLSPTASAQERAAEMTRGLAALANASPAEALLGVYVREQQAGRAAAALPILRTIAQLAPNDAFIAFSVFQSERAGKQPAELVRLERELLARFPDYAVGYNQYAYDLHYAGEHDQETAAVQRYATLAPTQPNPHDTWADLLIMHGRLDDAVGHAQASVRLDSTWTAGFLKVGAIDLARGRVNEARAMFTRAYGAAPTIGGRLDARHWTAASYVLQRNTRQAFQELLAIAGDAESANASAAARALPHQRLAVLEAMIGDRRNAAAHLEHGRAIGGGVAVQTWHSAIAQAASGDTAAARVSADAFAAIPNVSAQTTATLRAFVAVAARNYAAAETALAGSAPADLLAKSLRAEVLKSQGRRAEAQALRDEVLQAVLKIDTNPQVDFVKLVARLRAEKV